MATVFGNAITFLNQLGFLDVVLPFILVFAILFGILEKTKVLGIDKFDGQEYTKKSLNSLVAVCVAFFVVASPQLVPIINKALAQVIILLLIVVFYLILIGVFYKNSEDVFLEGGWRRGFMVALLIGIVLIFVNAIPMANGQSVLVWFYGYVSTNVDSGYVSAIVLLLFIALVVWFLSKDSVPKK
jgi:hypothetical protein